MLIYGNETTICQKDYATEETAKYCTVHAKVSDQIREHRDNSVAYHFHHESAHHSTNNMNVQLAVCPKSPRESRR